MISLDPVLADAIREQPDDDAPRLAAAKQMPADRGELVMVQCALARASGEEREPLETRERALLRMHGEAWTGAWRHAAQSWRWSRGFVEEIHLRASLVLAESMASIGASEPGVRVLRLGLQQQTAEWDDIESVLASGSLSSVRALRIEEPVHPHAGSLYGQVQEADRVVRAISRAGDWPLEDLELNAGTLGEGPIGVLLRSSMESTLTRLALVGCGITARSISHIAAAGSALTELDLSRNSVSGPAARELSRATGLERLTRLVLERASLSHGAVMELGRSRRLPALVELFLSGNAIGDAGAEVLAAASRLAKLSRLDLSYCGIMDGGAAALASSPHLSGLSELVLTGNVIGHPGQKRLRDRFGDRVRLDRQGEFRA